MTTFASIDCLSEIKKRDGTIVEFNPQRIEDAVLKAMIASKQGSSQEARTVTRGIVADLAAIKHRFKEFVPDVEGVQDIVEKNLILEQYTKAAKAYILYREQHQQARESVKTISAEFANLSSESRKYFKSKFNEFVYLRTYARWIEQHGRRETWVETVDRYMDFMKNYVGEKLSDREYQEVEAAILKQDVMPSMRLMQFAGKAASSTHVCTYNCSYIAPSNLDDFGEVLYILMCGTGVGFSVENKNVHALPQIRNQSGKKLKPFLVPDSREGWSDAVKLGMHAWFDGADIDFDFSLCRPAGARLKTFGGKSAGPEPLRDLLGFLKEKILKRQGARLLTIDVHDILCKMGEVVVTGGVRRSAMISLSEPNDTTMRDAKKGQFYLLEPQRSIANNSSVYSKKPSNEDLLTEWISLIKSGSGERGFFNRGGLIDSLPTRRLEYLEGSGDLTMNRISGLVGTNPCGEIVLKNKQFCNLTEVVARPEDTQESLREKIRLATLLGTYQASLTDFPYLSKEWKENCEGERLLGVSLTGQWDCEAARDETILRILKEDSIEFNRSYSERLGVNPSTAITCVKPSGNVSQVVECSSGMHPRFAPYYVRRVRIAASDSLFEMCKSQGVPYHPEVGQSYETATTFVLEFPVRAPEKSIFQNDLTAIQQLDHWKMVKTAYTEHNPSVTVYVAEDEWIEVAYWLIKNWDIVGGLTFLPKSKHVYRLAPYEEITKQRYEEMEDKFRKIDFSALVLFEREDGTEMKKELACSGSNCEL